MHAVPAARATGRLPDGGAPHTISLEGLSERFAKMVAEPDAGRAVTLPRHSLPGVAGETAREKAMNLQNLFSIEGKITVGDVITCDGGSAVSREKPEHVVSGTSEGE